MNLRGPILPAVRAVQELAIVLRRGTEHVPELKTPRLLPDSLPISAPDGAPLGYVGAFVWIERELRRAIENRYGVTLV